MLIVLLLSYVFITNSSNKRTDDGRTSHKKLEIYSLATHQIVMAPNFDVGPDYDISALDVNEREIVVVCSVWRLSRSNYACLAIQLDL